MGAGTSGRERRFRDFPLGIVSEVVVVVWERDGSECKINVSN